MQSRDRNRTSLRVRRMTYAAVCLALAMVLPFLTGQIPQIGSLLSPMHIPAFLCGFLCGWPWGLAVGFIAPLLRSVLFSMPKLFPTAVAMAFELAAYGAVAGILYRAFRRKKWAAWVSLGVAMIAGRILYALVTVVITGLPLSAFPLSFLALFTGSWPGIILHAVLVPPIVMALEWAGMTA